MVITHETAPPFPASNLDAVRHTSSSTSCATSSDCAGSRSTFLMMPKTGALSSS